MKRNYVLFSFISIKNEFGFVPYPKMFSKCLFLARITFLQLVSKQNNSLSLRTFKIGPNNITILKVLLQTSLPYKDPFDDIVEVFYAFKGIRGVLIHSKKNIRHKCIEFRCKPQEYNSYKFEKISSTFQVWDQVQVALMLHSHEKISTKNFCV